MLSEKNSAKIKNELINVFKGYMALNILNDNFISDQIKLFVESDLEQSEIFLDESNNIKINITKEVNETGVKIKFSADSPKEFILKDGIAEYTPEDFAGFLNNNEFNYESSNNNIFFATYITSANNKTIKIGGKDKIGGGNTSGGYGLYSLHIDNLGKMIKHFSDPSLNANNMLVSLTTGSGKTFTQALALIAMELAGIKGIFTFQNDTLHKQFYNDLARILNKDPAKLDNIIIQNKEQFMNSDVSQIKSDETIFVFDEADRLAEDEKTFLKAKEIAGKFINLYLTATPNLGLQEIAKGQDEKNPRELTNIARMTNQEKVKGGYAEQSTAFEGKTKNLDETDKKTKHGNIKQKLQRWVARLIDPNEPSSVANTFAETFLFNVNVRNQKIKTKATDLDSLLRWQLEPSALQNKILICSNNFNDIVNLNHFFHREEDKPFISETFYHNKNFFNRNNVYNFLLIEENQPDSSSYEEYNAYLENQLKQNIYNKINKIATQNGIQASHDELLTRTENIANSIKNYSPTKMSRHALSDNIMSFILGYEHLKDGKNTVSNLNQKFGQSYLDSERANNLDNLKTNILEKSKQLKHLTVEQIAEFFTFNAENNTKGIDPENASKLAEIIHNVINNIDRVDIEHVKSFANNWPLDPSAFMLFTDLTLGKQTISFLEPISQLYWFSEKVEQNETIEKNNVFNKFEISYTSPNQPEDSSKAKLRARRAVEALDPYYYEATAKPLNLASLNPTIATNLFSMGLTSVAVTTDLFVGYNDPNLHSVAILAPDETNKFVNPSNIAQTYGRNRGLNKLRTPMFFLATQIGVKLDYGVKELNKEDNSKEYDSSLKTFKAKKLKQIGKELSEDIIDWIKANADYAQNITDENLSNQVIELCLDKIDKINQENAFKFNVTKDDFVNVTKYAIQNINKYRMQTIKGTELGLLVRFVGNLLNFISKIISNKPIKHAKNELNKTINWFEDKDKTDEIKLYQFIINNTSIQNTWLATYSFNVTASNFSRVLSQSYTKRLEDIDKDIKLIFKNSQNFDDKTILTLQFIASLNAINKNKKALHNLHEFNLSDISNFEENPKLNPDVKEYHISQINKFLENVCGKHATYDNMFDLSLPDIFKLLNTIAELPYDLEIDVKPVQESLLKDCAFLFNKILLNDANLDSLQYLNKTFTGEDLKIIFNNDNLKAEKVNNFINELLECSNHEISKQQDFYIKYFMMDENSKSEGFQIIQDIQHIFKTIDKCYGLFYAVDEKGKLLDEENRLKSTPEFLENSHDSIKKIHVNDNNYFWRQMFFLNNLQQILPVSNSLQASTANKQLEQLENITNNMLKIFSQKNAVVTNETLGSKARSLKTSIDETSVAKQKGKSFIAKEKLRKKYNKLIPQQKGPL